eukprot:2793485-Prymnesium_polylepis.1
MPVGVACAWDWAQTRSSIRHCGAACWQGNERQRQAADTGLLGSALARRGNGNGRQCYHPRRGKRSDSQSQRVVWATAHS